MKIGLFGIDSLDSNATQQRLYFIALEMIALGWSVTLYIPPKPANIAFVRQRLKNATVIWIESGHLFGQAFEKFTKTNSFDLTICVGSGVRYLTVKRTGMLLHDFDELTSRFTTLSLPKKLYYRLVEAAALAASDAVLCASIYLLSVLKHRASFSKPVILMPNGYDSVQYDRVPHKCIAKSPAANLAYVGTITKLYQIYDLLDLAVDLKRRSVTAVINIFGAGEEMESFSRSAAKQNLLDVVKLHGFIPNEQLFMRLAAMDVLLFPIAPTTQNQARCPVKTYQYIAAQRPIVTCRVGEVHRALGENAFYYTFGNRIEMADATVRAIAASKDDQWVLGVDPESHTWASRAAQLDKDLKALCSNGNGHVL